MNEYNITCFIMCLLLICYIGRLYTEDLHNLRDLRLHNCSVGLSDLQHGDLVYIKRGYLFHPL